MVENYTLPDGTVIKMGQERFEAPEVLFKPELVGVESKGMADTLFDVIQVTTTSTAPDIIILVFNTLGVCFNVLLHFIV